jgi:hypothetical protein
MTERTAEEWGRVAVGLPGWRWLINLPVRGGTIDASPFLSPVSDEWASWWGNSSAKYLDDLWVDPDDPATAGCLLALLGPGVRVWMDGADGLWTVEVGGVRASMHSTLSRACIAAAETARAWPGGEP